MSKRITEETWPHGTKHLREQDESELSDEKETAFLRGIALSAHATGLLDRGASEVVKVLKKLASHPSDLMRELRKMGAQSGRAKQTVQQIRKDL